MPIIDIFQKLGEEAFRDAEEELLEEIASLRSPFIVSCGGGVPLRKENRNIMNDTGTVVLLNASPLEILDRLSEDDSRPLLSEKKDLDHISSMLSERSEAYSEAADFTIDTGGKSPEDVAFEIIKRR